MSANVAAITLITKPIVSWPTVGSLFPVFIRWQPQNNRMPPASASHTGMIHLSLNQVFWIGMTRPIRAKKRNVPPAPAANLPDPVGLSGIDLYPFQNGLKRPLVIGLDAPNEQFSKHAVAAGGSRRSRRRRRRHCRINKVPHILPQRPPRRCILINHVPARKIRLRDPLADLAA
jgi:hypothetical protein